MNKKLSGATLLSLAITLGGPAAALRLEKLFNSATGKPQANRKPHQGAKEKARRLKQMGGGS